MVAPPLPREARRSCIPRLQLLLLLAIAAEGPLCGYRLHRLLKRLGIEVSDAAIYKALSNLEQRGLIEVVERGTRGRVKYQVTPAGLEEAAQLVRELEELYAAVRALLSAVPSSEGGASFKPCNSANPTGGRGEE